MKSHRMKIYISKKEVTISRFGMKTKIPLTDEPYPLYSIKKDTEANNLKHLEKRNQNIISNVLEKSENIFPDKLNELGRTNIVQHEVRSTGEPFALKYYKTPITLSLFVKEHIKNMLKHQIIRPSNGPYRSLVVMVKKKTGDRRFCIE